MELTECTVNKISTQRNIFIAPDKPFDKHKNEIHRILINSKTSPNETPCFAINKAK